MDWSKLDPNAVLAIIVTVGGFVYHLFHKSQQVEAQAKIDNIGDFLLGELRQAYQVYLSTDADRATAQALLEERAWSALTRIKVPRNALIESMVHAAIAMALAELDDKLNQHKMLTARLSEMVARAVEANQKMWSVEDPTHPLGKNIGALRDLATVVELKPDEPMPVDDKNPTTTANVTVTVNPK